jgi:hypothetical protein
MPCSILLNADNLGIVGVKGTQPDGLGVLPLGIALACQAAILFLLVVRWRLLLRSLVGGIGFRDALSVQSRAMVLGMVGLGQVGQEGYRLFASGARLGDYVGAATVQAAERVFGLAALALLAGVGLWGWGTQYPQELLAAGPMVWAVCLGCFAFGAGIALVTYLRRSRRAPISEGRGWRRTPRRAWHVVRTLCGKPRLAAVTFTLSVAVHICAVCCTWLLAVSMGLAAEFGDFLVVVPIVSLAAALPISIAGLGVYEGSMVALLSPITGASSGEILLLCAVGRLAAALPPVGALCGLLVTGKTRGRGPGHPWDQRAGGMGAAAAQCPPSKKGQAGLS